MTVDACRGMRIVSAIEWHAENTLTRIFLQESTTPRETPAACELTSSLWKLGARRVA